MPGFDIPKHLYEGYTAYAPEQLTFVETIGRKHGLSPERIRLAQEGLSKGLAHTRVWLSEPDEIEGFRRMAVVGAGKNTIRSMKDLRLNEQEVGKAYLYAVSTSGGLFIRSYRRDYGQSTGEVIENALNEKASSDPDMAFPMPPFDINHFSHAGQHLKRVLYDARMSALRDGMGNVDGDDQFFAEISAVIASRAGRNGGGIRKAMKEALDPKLVKTAWGHKQSHDHMLAWLSGTIQSNGTFVSLADLPSEAVADRARNRLQAMRVYPALASVLERDKITAAIDQGRPMNPIIAEELNIPERKLSLIQGKGARLLASPEDEATIAVLAYVDESAPPKNGKEWGALWKAAAALRGQFNVSSPIAREYGLSEVLEKRYAETISRNIPSITDFAEKYPEITSGNVSDMFTSISRKLLIPALHEAREKAGKPLKPWTIDRAVRATLSSEVFLAASLKDIQSASERWHRSMFRIEDRLGGALTALANHKWRTILGSTEINGYSVKEIDSDAGLTRRGKDCNHCVGGYGPSVRRAGHYRNFSMIFAIDKDDTAVSTLEVRGRETDDGITFDIVQNRGDSNAKIEAGAEQVGKEILARIKSLPEEDVALYRKRMGETEHQREESMGGLSELVRLCDAPVYEPGYFEMAWEELSPCLPRKMRKAGLEALVQKFDAYCDIADIADIQSLGRISRGARPEPLEVDDEDLEMDDEVEDIFANVNVVAADHEENIPF